MRYDVGMCLTRDGPQRGSAAGKVEHGIDALNKTRSQLVYHQSIGQAISDGNSNIHDAT